MCGGNYAHHRNLRRFFHAKTIRDMLNKHNNGDRFTYRRLNHGRNRWFQAGTVRPPRLCLRGVWAGRTAAKRRVFASTIAWNASRLKARC